MPSMPKNKTLGDNASAANLVNTLTKDIVSPIDVPHVYAVGERMATGGIANKETSLNSLRDAGTTIVNYQPLSNAFLSALVNRIGMVLITSKLYSNPWARFKRGTLEFGETVEEIFANIMSAKQYDPDIAEEQVERRNKPDVRSAFHTLNYQKFYKTTVSNEQLRQAFLSFDGISNLVGKIIESMYTSANYDEFLVMRYLIGIKAVGGSFYPVNIAAPTPANSNSIVTTMKTISDDITELAPDYNEAGVHAYSNKEDQYFIMTNKFANLIDVETLALAFNLDKVELMGRIIRVKSFGFSTQELARLNELFADGNPNYVPIDSATNDLFKAIPAVCVDREFFMIFDNLTTMRERANEEGLYWNYWLHLWKTFSTSPFANAIVFTDATPAVVSVTVSPDTVTAKKGNLITFNVDVEVTGYASAQVNWTMTGNTSTNTKIDQQGRVTIAKDEAGPTITVTATSWFDQTKKGEATITIS